MQNNPDSAGDFPEKGALIMIIVSTGWDWYIGIRLTAILLI